MLIGRDARVICIFGPESRHQFESTRFPPSQILQIAIQEPIT